MNRLLRIPEACAALGIGRTRLYELVRDGRLQAVHLGRSVRILQASVEALIERLCKEEATR